MGPEGNTKPKCPAWGDYPEQPPWALLNTSGELMGTKAGLWHLLLAVKHLAAHGTQTHPQIHADAEAPAQ